MLDSSKPTTSNPSTPSTTTSTAASGSAPGALLPGGSASSVSRSSTPRLTLSAHTCITLLPTLTPEQVNFELQYLQSLDPDWSCTARNIVGKREALHKHLVDGLITEMSDTVDKFNSIYNSFSCAVKLAEETVLDITNGALELIDGAKAKQTDPPVPLPSSQTASLQTAGADGNGNIDPDDPVSLCVCDLSDITIDDMLGELTFDTDHPGGRKTVYFGQVPYSYGKFDHPAASYPTSQLFDKIFDKLASIDEEITPSEYTCLCSLYPDGSAGIPLHSDNERAIVPDSTIYTVSFGETRDLRVTNTVGPPIEHKIRLEHGSVYSMSRKSQDTWRHGIDRDPTVKKPRLSLTFRKLQTPALPPPKTPVPPVAPPSSQRIPLQHSRVLLIHDSIIQDAPDRVFEHVPGHTCVKRLNYQLADVFNFEPEFEHAKTVTISCGINDLARYGKTASMLADTVCPDLIRCCRKYSRTNFIFTSLTLARDKSWLNTEVLKFNQIMQDLARNIPNLLYYDSHGLICRHVHPDRVWDMNDRNGIHLVFDVRKLVTRELVNCVGRLAGSKVPHHRNCEWLYYVSPSFR